MQFALIAPQKGVEGRSLLRKGREGLLGAGRDGEMEELIVNLDGGKRAN